MRPPPDFNTIGRCNVRVHGSIRALIANHPWLTGGLAGRRLSGLHHSLPSRRLLRWSEIRALNLADGIALDFVDVPGHLDVVWLDVEDAFGHVLRNQLRVFVEN